MNWKFWKPKEKKVKVWQINAVVHFSLKNRNTLSTWQELCYAKDVDEEEPQNLYYEHMHSIEHDWKNMEKIKLDNCIIKSEEVIAIEHRIQKGFYKYIKETTI